MLVMREETCCHHFIGYFFLISYNVHHPIDRISHNMAFVTPVVEANKKGVIQLTLGLLVLYGVDFVII